RKVNRVSTLLASLTLLVQIDTKHHVDKTYELPRLWALTAPIAWTLCGIIGLDATRVILTDKRISWKGRQLPKQERAVLPQIVEQAQYQDIALAISHELRAPDYGKDGFSGSSQTSVDDTV